MEKITIDYLLDLFTMQSCVYDKSFYQYFLQYDNDDLKQMLEYIEIMVDTNKEKKMFSSDVKNNIYRLLSVYRERFKEPLVLEKVNEIISMLNSSKEENLENFLKAQFFIRMLGVSNVKKWKDIEKLDIFLYESQINLSICNDLNFLSFLSYSELNDFIHANMCKPLPLTNLSYLLHNYPEVLNTNDIKNKINRLLSCNAEFSKFEVVNVRLMDSGDLVHYEIPSYLKLQNKLCMQKVKKLKLDK